MKMFRVVVNGNEYEVGIEEIQKEITVKHQESKTAPPVQREKPTATAKPEPAKAAGGSEARGNIVAPMPGTILRVDVSVGAAVTKGDTLLILEAMKMENEILAPNDGIIKQLNVAQGASVNPGDLLVVLGT